MNQDYFELKKVPGFFGSDNEGALWLQEHKDDPYWMAHQLNNAVSPQDYSHFEEYWQMARQIRGYEPL